jgi:uncharacterized coiled-coil protein SlyX
MENIFIILTGLIQTGAVSYIVYAIIKGLKTEVKTLGTVVATQNDTIKTMDKRIQETEKIGDLYKQLIADFPKALDDYQAVITKTKDSTIFELKSKLEEQQLTIEDLKQKSENSSPAVAARAANISKLFLDKENKQLLEFLQKVDTDIDNIFSSIFEEKDFDKLMSRLKKEIIITENDIRIMFIDDEHMRKYKARNASFNINGNAYIITFDDKIYTNTQTLAYFQSLYNALS